jgi:hypothetical protein
MAMVQVYPKAEQDRSTSPLVEIPSGEGGVFTLELPQGRYWVWAKATVEENGRETRLVGQAVPNPVEFVAGSEVAVKIEMADPSGFAENAGPSGAGVRGRVRFPQGKERTASVYAYPGFQERPIGPGFVAAVDLSGDGSFAINLVPGKYTIAVRQRKSGKDYGPPEKTDYVATRKIEVAQNAYFDTGELVPALIDPDMWKVVTAKLGTENTLIEGRILDAAGHTVEGIRVLAFKDGRLSGKPAFVSPPSGKDGKYSLILSPGGGTFFLGARSRLGGPASPGEKTGQERGEKGLGISVGSGEHISGIDITVEEVW